MNVLLFQIRKSALIESTKAKALAEDPVLRALHETLYSRKKP